MRHISILLVGAALGSCVAGAEPGARTVAGQRSYETLLAGKVAGAPTSCLPTYNMNDMIVIDGRTIAYRVGAARAYVMELSQGCGLLGSGNYTLITRQFGGMGLCRGDIAQVADLTSRSTVGSCSVMRIVPYGRPG